MHTMLIWLGISDVCSNVVESTNYAKSSQLKSKLGARFQAVHMPSFGADPEGQMPEELEPLIFVDSKIQRSHQTIHIAPAAHNPCGV